MQLEAARYADRILTHYIVRALHAAGEQPDSDTYAELGGLIENAIVGAVQPLLARIGHLERLIEEKDKPF